jgi:hypothetical protein
MLQDEAKMLISDAIKNQLSETEMEDYESNFILVDVFLLVGENIEPLNSSLVSCNFRRNEIDLDVKVIYEDAFGLSEAWSSLKVSEFHLTLGDEVIKHKGTYSINAFAIKSISPEHRTCVISMQLIKE